MANAKQRISGVSAELQGRMKRVGDLVGGDLGNDEVRPRGKREQADYWVQIMGLPPQERGALLTDLVARSGHTDAEEQPCDLCKFVSYHGAKGTE